MTETANPLEAIRATEFEMARRLEEARVEADEVVAAARREARRLVEEARRRGRAEAHRRSEATVAAAEAEAAEILARGDLRAERLRDETRPDRARTVEAMVEFVLSPPPEPEAPP